MSIETPRTYLRKNLWAALIVALAISIGQPTLAEGAVVPSGTQAVLTEADMLLIEGNPALRELSAISPELLRKALDLIAEARLGRDQGRGLGKVLEPLDIQLMEQNPILREVWQNSPEASADLLQLLKSAGAGGKSQK